MKAKITKRAVDTARPGESDQFLWDTELKGFGLKVTPAGNKIYILQARVGGRVRRYTIGNHGSPWTAEKARDEALRLRGAIAGGADPAAEKARARRDMTIARLCDLYLDEGCETKKATTLAVERGLIRRHIRPLLGSRQLSSLSRADIERFLADVASGKTATDERTKRRGRAIVKGGRGTANRSTDLLASMLSFAAHRGLRPDNPARGVKKFALQSRERYLTPAELSALGEALARLEADGQNPYAIAAIRLLLLTGCRKMEILSLRRGWIDFERSCLRLPDSKTGAKVVPLGRPALNLLRQLPYLDGNDHVFPSSRGQGHLVGLSKIWRRVRARAGLDDVRLHDLRHSFASYGASGGDSLYVLGKLLGHRQQNSTQRYAHLSDDPLRAAADRISTQISNHLVSMVAKNHG